MKNILLSILLVITSCGSDPTKSYERAEEDVDGNIAFVGVNVVTMENEEILMNQTVLVTNGVISEIGALAEVPPDYFVIDARNQYLMPGLADMHTHVNYVEDLLPFVANGVTTILNMGSSSSILELKERARKKEIISPTILASAFVDGVGSRGWVITSPQEAVADIAQIKSQGWDFIKVYNGIKKDVFNSIQNEASKNDLAIIGHGVRDPGMEFILSHGQVMVAHMEEYFYTYFNNSIDDGLIPSAIVITQANGTFVTPNLSAYEAIAIQWGNPAGLTSLLKKDGIKYVSPKWKEFWKTASYTSNTGTIQLRYDFLKRMTKEFDDAGIPLLLGTDSPYIPGLPNGFSIHDDLRNMTAAGLSPFHAIKAGTITSGEFIRKFVKTSPRFGIVREGYQADLILLSANPFEHVENIKKRVGVMARGRWMSERFLQNKLLALVN